MFVVLTDFLDEKVPSEENLEKYSYREEKELQEEVSKHYHEVLGENVIPIGKPVSISLPSLRGKTIPDDFALDLTDEEKPKLLLIEYELSIHKVYSHISTQILKFKDAVRNNKQNIFETLREKFEDPDTQLKLYDSIYNQPIETLVIIDNVEAVFHMIKTKFGDSVSSKKKEVADKRGFIESPLSQYLRSYSRNV